MNSDAVVAATEMRLLVSVRDVSEALAFIREIAGRRLQAGPKIAAAPPSSYA